MSPVDDLAARLVEVIADLGESAPQRYRYGSGCVVRGRTVLTAAHVVAGATRVKVRDPDKKMRSATVDPRFVGDVNGPGPDLALVEIEDATLDLPAIELAQIDRAGPSADPVERCHVFGYPWFAETPSPTAVRDTVDAIGVVPVLSRLVAGLISVQVSVSPRPLPAEQVPLGDSEWSGMSGGPVVAAGRLLGVVIEHAPREGQSTVTAVPLSAVEADPAHPGWGRGVDDPAAWWTRLGADGLGDLLRLPARPQRRPPPYRDTLRQFGETLHTRMPQLLGRERELAEIATFTTGTERYRWLVGGAFGGKTALLYEAASVGLPAEVDVICYFLSRRASDADSNRFLTAVVPQLAYLCDVDPPTADRDQFNALWREAADRAAKLGRHLLLVVDGLDEDLHPSGSPSVASLLPPLVAGRTHVLVASRPYPELPVDVPDAHPLKATRPVQLEPFEGAQELAERAREEIYNLTHGPDINVAVDTLGLLTAAAGPLAIRDLATLSNDLAAPSAAQTLQVRRLVTEQAARSLELVGAASPRYQFAHYSLLEYAKVTEDLGDPEYRDRIHRWAEQWRRIGWPLTGVSGNTPRYLLDSYPATLAGEPERLAALVSDAGWVEVAIRALGVDRVLADLRQAVSVGPTDRTVGAMLAAVVGQSSNLAPTRPLEQPGYVLRQLCLQAAELRENSLAEEFRARLRTQAGPGLLPLWTTRGTSRALFAELGRHDESVGAVAVLPDGRIFSSGYDGRVLMWDPAKPGARPVEIGRHPAIRAVAALSDGRVVTGGDDRRVLVWDPDRPGASPVELGRHDGPVWAVAVLPDGRVVSGGDDQRVLMWDPDRPGTDSVEPEPPDGPVWAVAALPDGRVVSGGEDGRVLVWYPDRLGGDPMTLGRHDRRVNAVAVLPDGRIVSSGDDGRVLVWDPDRPGASPVELGRRYDPVVAVAALPDGRVVSSGEDGWVLMWNPAKPGARPVEIGRPDGEVNAVVALPDGRIVSGGDYWVLVWNPAKPGGDPAKIGRHDDPVVAVAALPDGRVVSGGYDGRVLVWNPKRPGGDPVKLGRHDRGVNAVVALPDGRVVSSGWDRRVLVWDLTTRTQIAQLGCSAAALATGQHAHDTCSVLVAHDGSGLSLWSISSVVQR